MMNMDSGQLAEHDSNHADVQPSLRMGGLDFIMTDQAAMFHKPTKSPLDNPAFRQGRKAAPVFVSRHDFQAQGIGFAMRGHPAGELIAAVALVGPETAQPPEAGH